MHDPRQPRRTGHARLHDVPLKRQPHPDHQRLLLAAGVGLSALVIFALYAASYPYQRSLHADTAEELPRWGTLKESALDALDQASAIGEAAQTIDAALTAKAAQAEGIAIMKAKLESSTTTHQ